MSAPLIYLKQWPLAPRRALLVVVIIPVSLFAATVSGFAHAVIDLIEMGDYWREMWRRP